MINVVLVRSDSRTSSHPLQLTSVSDLLAQVEQKTKKYVMSVKKSLADGSTPNENLVKDLHESKDVCLKLSQEKFQYASAIYDVVRFRSLRFYFLPVLTSCR
jgi:hypothetical protein